MFCGQIEKVVSGQREDWSLGQLSVLRHNLLEHRCWHGDGLTLLICRERCVGEAAIDGWVSPPAHLLSGEDLHEALSRQKCWPLDWQAILIDHRHLTVAFHAGHGGVAPLYVRPSGWSIEVSFDITDFYAGASLSEVDCDWTAFRLTGNPPYGAATLLHNLYMVTERAELQVDAIGAARTVYPPAAPYYIPTPLRPQANIPDTACQFIDALLARWPLEGQAIIAEFSGGMDSAVTAALLARRFPDQVTTAALEISGSAAEQQKMRRALAARHFGFCDQVLSVAEVAMLPASLSADADYAPAPHNADLQRPLSLLFSALQRKLGPAVIATGTGGDELHMLHAFEQAEAQLARNLSDAYLPLSISPAIAAHHRAAFAEYARKCERAPFSVLPTSALEAGAARAPLFLRHGLWPVSPFAQAESVRFYRSLPREWRAGKHLHRAMVERLGYPAGFLDVPLRENFEPYLTDTLLALVPAIRSDLRRHCCLHDLGIVRGESLIQAFEALRKESPLEEVGFLFHAYTIEAILRRLGVARPAALRQDIRNVVPVQLDQAAAKDSRAPRRAS